MARRLAVAIIAVPLLAYPVAVAADGVRFPFTADCVRKARPVRRTRSTWCSAGVTRRPRRSAYSSVCEASGMSTPE